MRDPVLDALENATDLYDTLGSSTHTMQRSIAEAIHDLDSVAPRL